LKKIPKNDIKILSDLKKDKVLAITRADKGNTVDYDRQMKTIISDTITYKKLDFDLTDKNVESTKKQLESLKNNLYNTLQFYKKNKNIQGFVLHPRFMVYPKFIRLEPPSIPLHQLCRHLFQN